MLKECIRLEFYNPELKKEWGFYLTVTIYLSHF
jgi:hypothetical protein